jgi:hypothetical protein
MRYACLVEDAAGGNSNFASTSASKDADDAGVGSDGAGADALSDSKVVV